MPADQTALQSASESITCKPKQSAVSFATSTRARPTKHYAREALVSLNSFVCFLCTHYARDAFKKSLRPLGKPIEHPTQPIPQRHNRAPLKASKSVLDKFASQLKSALAIP